MQPKQDKANNFNVFIRNGDWLVWIGWAARLNPLINSRPPADIHDCHSHIWRLHNFEQSFDASRLLLNSPFFSSNNATVRWILQLLASIYTQTFPAASTQHTKPPKCEALLALRRDLSGFGRESCGFLPLQRIMGQLQQRPSWVAFSIAWGFLAWCISNLNETQKNAKRCCQILPA